VKHYQFPIEHQILALQQIAHRTGWDQGKRENLQWAIQVLRDNDYPDAADLLERHVLGETIWRIKQASRFKPGQHKASHQASKVKAPTTTVQWPHQKP